MTADQYSALDDALSIASEAHQNEWDNGLIDHPATREQCDICTAFDEAQAALTALNPDKSTDKTVGNGVPFVIVIEGGCVQAVFTDTTEAVVIIDHDVPSEDGKQPYTLIEPHVLGLNYLDTSLRAHVESTLL